MAQSGIASRANAPRMMAGGGIVALAPGGPVSSQEKLEQIQTIRAKIASGEISAAEGEAQIEAIAPTKTPKGAMPDATKQSSMQRMMSPTMRAFGDRSQKTPEAVEFDAIQGGPTKTSGDKLDISPDMGNFGPVGQGAQLGATTNVSPPIQGPPVGPPSAKKPPTKPPVEPYATPQLGKGLGAITAPNARTQYLDGDYSVAMSDASSTADAQAGIKSLMDQKPKDVREEAMTYGLEQLGMSDDRVAAEQARQKALADFDAKQSKSNKSEELSAFLRGIGQSGRISGGSAAAANVRAQQQSGERARLLGRQQGERDFEGLEQEIKVKAYDSATKAFEIANQNVRQGVSSMTQFNATEVGLLSDNAKRLLDTDVANMEAEDRDAKRILDAQIANASNETKVAVANLEASISDRRTTLQNQMEKAKLGQLDRKDTNTLLNQVEKYQADVRAKYQKVYQDAIAALPFGDDNKAAEDALKVEMNAAITIALQGLAQRTKELETYLASLPTADGFGDLQ